MNEDQLKELYPDSYDQEYNDQLLTIKEIDNYEL